MPSTTNGDPLGDTDYLPREGCDRPIELVDGSWRVADRTVRDAIAATIWADRLEPDLRAWLSGPSEARQPKERADF